MADRSPGRRQRPAMASLLLVALTMAGPGQMAFGEEPRRRGIAVVAKDGVSSEFVRLYDRTWAVVIGIDDYPEIEDPRDRKLDYAEADARGVAALLRERFAFDVVETLLGAEASRDAILELLVEVGESSGEADAIFVFFAGHGMTVDTAQGALGYLVPADGRLGYDPDNLSMVQLRNEVFRLMRARHVFMVVDACYGGTLLKRRGGEIPSQRSASWLRKKASEPVRQVLTAGGAGERVLDGGLSGHSVFTARLIERLRAVDDYVTAAELSPVISEVVHEEAELLGFTQTPDYGVLSGRGDFVFVPRELWVGSDQVDPQPAAAASGGSDREQELQAALAERDAALAEAERLREELRGGKEAGEGPPSPAGSREAGGSFPSPTPSSRGDLARPGPRRGANSWQFNLAQANSHFRNRRMDEALRALRLVVTDPDGGTQEKAWELLYEVANRLSDVEAQLLALDGIREFAEGRQRAAAAENRQRLLDGFVRVVFETAPGRRMLPRRGVVLAGFGMEDMTRPADYPKESWELNVALWGKEEAEPEELRARALLAEYGYAVGEVWLPDAVYLVDGNLLSLYGNAPGESRTIWIDRKGSPLVQ